MRYKIIFRFPDSPEDTVSAMSTKGALAMAEDLRADGAEIVGIVDANGTEWTLHDLETAVDETSFD